MLDSVNVNITLGEEQEQALKMMKEFLQEKKKPSCLYYGSAGTGKSILVNYLINWCEQQNIQYVLCAPTHKAALVLSRYTDRSATTIHKLLALSPNIKIFELDFRNLLFLSSKNPGMVPYNGVVICDEASMINDDLYETLLKKCQERNSQIIFTGDFKQLQPVKQDYITKIINVEPKFELTKIWRQSSENALLPVLQTLRNSPINRFTETTGNEGSLIVTSDIKEFMLKAGESLKKSVKNYDILGAKVLAFTNDRVNAYNNAFHKILFGPEEYYKGEFLIGQENLTFNSFQFYNSMDYIILDEPIKTDLSIPYFGKLPAWSFELYDSLTKMSERISILSREISRDYFDSLAQKIEYYRWTAVEYTSQGNKMKASYYWKKYFEMINSFTSPVNLFYDGRLIRKQSFGYSYAITTHKSQGSSYNEVFVDIRNINSCIDEAVRRQLQYVALSRTRHNVFIFQ